jgi:hypothetical protein
VKDDEFDSIWEKGDPFDHPAWKAGEERARKTKEVKGKNYFNIPLEWLKQVLPHIKHKNQLVVMLVIYRLTIMRRSKTVSLTNGELEELGISRFAKSRALASLKLVKLIKIAHENGKAVTVTRLK